MIIENFEPFIGQHCETNTTGNLLKHCGIELSEPMLYGLGEGLAFGVFAFKNMPVPFIGGRPRGEEITKALSRYLNFDIEYRQTRSKKKAWNNVTQFIESGKPVGIKLDAYFLEYFNSKVHFAGHYVAMYGYNDDKILVVDTDQQGGLNTTSRDNFEKARLWKGPMSSNALTWTLTTRKDDIDWPTVLRAAIASNAQSYLNPPIKNFGAKGIRKAARLVPTWIDRIKNAPTALAQTGMLMERGGTGGSLFRAMYRDFLTEANTHLYSSEVETARDMFAEAALLWTEVADRFSAVEQKGSSALSEAAELLLHLAAIEEEAVTMLSTYAN